MRLGGGGGTGLNMGGGGTLIGGGSMCGGLICMGGPPIGGPSGSFLKANWRKNCFVSLFQ